MAPGRYTVDEELRDSISAEIGDDVAKKTRAGVQRKLDDFRDGTLRDEEGNIREDAGFFEKIWAWIKGKIFQFLEMIGMADTVAGWFGMKIPGEQDTKALSSQITRSVSEAMATKDAAGNLVATTMERGDFQKTLEEKLAYDIAHNKALAGKFSEKDIREIAAKTAAEAATQEKIDRLRERTQLLTQGVGPSQRAAVTTVGAQPQPPASASPQQKAGHVLSEITDDLLPQLVDLNDPKNRALVDKIKPQLITAGADMIVRDPSLIDDPKKLSAALVKIVGKSPDVQAALSELDPLKAENALPVLEISLTNFLENDTYKNRLQQAVQASPEVAATPTAEAAPDAAQKPTIHVDKLAHLGTDEIKAMIADGVAQSIKKESVMEVVKEYNDSFRLGGKAYIGHHEDIAKIKDYVSWNKEKNANYSITGDSNIPYDVSTAMNHVYDWAVEKKYAPDDKQRSGIGEIVADASMRALGNLENQGLDRRNLAARVSIAINADLRRMEKYSPVAGKSGVSISDINSRTFGSNRDLIGDVGHGIDVVLYNPEKDTGKVFEQLKDIQFTLLRRKEEAEKAMLASAKGAVDGAGIGGAEEHEKGEDFYAKAGVPGKGPGANNGITG